MAAKLIIVPEAEEDIAQAYGWYENQRVGLGEEFLSCVDACVQTIRRVPELYPLVRGNYRRALVRRFPYLVFFEIHSETVTVYCIFHTSQDPAKWRKRLT